MARADRLRVDPARFGHLPRTQQREHADDPGQPSRTAHRVPRTRVHAALPAGTVRPTTATIPALANARRPSSRYNVDAVSVCGMPPCQPCGRLAFTSAVFTVPVFEAVTSTATRLVCALAGWRSRAPRRPAGPH